MASTALKQHQNLSKPPITLTQAWLEPRFVAITALAIALSIIGENRDFPGWLILSLNITAYIAGGLFGAKTALESLFVHRKIDVDMLMVMAALGAAVIGQWHEGALLLFLFSLSNVLQDYAIGRSRQAIRGLLKLHPDQAVVRRDNKKVIVSVQDILSGEMVLIEPGERIPVDGIIRNGRSAVDQSPITGESMPVDKSTGDTVFAGTLNVQGALDVEATGRATDTVLARIIKMVEDAQDSKAPTERFLEKFEQYYAMFILGMVALFIVIPPALGWVTFEANFYRAMVLMTVASPCALIISTPAAFISAIASAARSGVLFKGGAYIEALAGLKAIAFDKTGTLTTGKVAVTDIVPHNNVSETHLLEIAAAVEDRSQHPLAKAIVRIAHERGITFSTLTDFEALHGRGVRATVDGIAAQVGSVNYMVETNPLPETLAVKRTQLEHEGKTVIGVVYGAEWLGLLALMDQVRPEARGLIETLHKQGIKVVMLTGDNAHVAGAVAAAVGVDKIYADLLPEDKARIIKEVENLYGATGMVGDGVNDAPALATASVGIAMGAAGTDVAMETADVVLMGDRLELIPFAIALSKKARRVVWQNIAFAIAVIVVLVSGTFIVSLPLPMGVLGHEGSTVIVVLNGLLQLLLIPEITRRRATLSTR